MRVSSHQIVERVLLHLNDHLGRLQRLQTQLASGKRLSRASDDTSRAAQALHLQAQGGQVEQYARNIEDGLGLARSSESALGDVNDVLRQARTLALAGAKDSLSQGERAALTAQVRNLRNTLLRVANSDFGGHKIFGGTVTDRPPFSFAADGSAQYAGNGEAIVRQVGKDFQQTVNVSGDAVFNVNSTAVSDAPDAFAVLAQIQTDIEDGNVTDLSTTRLQEIDALLRHVLGLRADLGARINTLEMAKNRVLDLQTTLRERLSETEDIELSEVVARLQTEQNVFQAALAATARIVPPSLLEFLR